MKQVEVTILGQGYVLGCPEGGESRLQSAVAAVDQEMTAIRDGGKVRARERIAVLAALNLAYQLSAPAPAPSTAPSSAPRPAPDDSAAVGSGPMSGNEASSPDLDALVRRLDGVLGSDGHLL